MFSSFQWQVCSGVLAIFHKLLQRHEASREDFLEQLVEVHGEGAALANKPPGHVLMVHMMNNSATLQMVGSTGSMELQLYFLSVSILLKETRVSVCKI